MTNSFSEHTFPEKSNSLNLYQQKEEVTALARILYKEIKDRVSTNVLLKFHNFFFVPMCVFFPSLPLAISGSVEQA